MLDAHRSAALADVDAVEGVSRMPDDGLVLLQPGEGVEVEHDVTVDLWVIEPEGDPVEDLAINLECHRRTGRSVSREARARVEHGWALAQRYRGELGGP